MHLAQCSPILHNTGWDPGGVPRKLGVDGKKQFIDHGDPSTPTC